MTTMHGTRPTQGCEESHKVEVMAAKASFYTSAGDPSAVQRCSCDPQAWVANNVHHVNLPHYTDQSLPCLLISSSAEVNEY